MSTLYLLWASTALQVSFFFTFFLSPFINFTVYFFHPSAPAPPLPRFQPFFAAPPAPTPAPAPFFLVIHAEVSSVTTFRLAPPGLLTCGGKSKVSLPMLLRAGGGRGLLLLLCLVLLFAIFLVAGGAVEEEEDEEGTCREGLVALISSA